MAENFNLITQYLGYRNKTDITALPPGTLISGSQNVVTSDGDRVASRKGYSLDGAANPALTPIISSYDWTSAFVGERNLRTFSTKIQFRYAATGAWMDLLTGLTDSAIYNWTTWWDVTNKRELLLFVNGSSNIYSWTGAISTIASATVNTVTLQDGTKTWASLGFLNNGTRSIIINGVSATYTGGEGTATLTGVSVDFSAQLAGAIVFQAVTVTANSAATGLPATFPNNLIEMANNYVYIGSLSYRDIYVSKSTNYLDFTWSAPVRLPTEGALLTLDSIPKAFIPQEDAMYFSAGDDQWYQTLFTPSADLVRETITVKKLKTSTQKGARSQGAVGKVINDIMFISQEPTLDTLGRVEQISTPQTRPLSDPIKLDFDSYDFTNCHVKYFKNYLYIALPVMGLVLMYNYAKGYWEPPQVLPVRRFAIIANALYGHSNAVPETYKLFDGYNDNGAPINAIAAFSYQNFGNRVSQKNFTEYYVEGYITANTILTATINYDYLGFSQILTQNIVGSSTSPIIFAQPTDVSLGTSSLGEESLAGGGGTDNILPPKFREIMTFQLQDFFEESIVFSSNDIDQRWEILAHGPETMATQVDPVYIKS